MVVYRRGKCILVLLFLSFSGLASTQNVRGIVLEANSNGIITNKKFLNILKKNKLKAGLFSEGINVWPLRFSSPQDKARSLEVCNQLKEFAQVKNCELDLKLEANSEELVECHLESNNLLVDKELLKSKETLFNSCSLIKKDASSQFTDGLSPYWAQEMTGADIVREKLEGLRYSTLPDNLIGIWDSEVDQHGELVSGLISSEEETALIPLKNNKPFKNLEFLSDYASNYTYYKSRCKSQGGCSKYINNSMKWDNSSIVGNVMSSMADEGSVIVVAAGNDEGLIDLEMTKQSKNQKVLLVSSVDPSGLPSGFTNFGNEALISAPSDNLIMSTNYQGRKKKFGGTSGAAPQVTAALAAFTLETGYDLSHGESKRILKNTALRFPHLPTPNLLGSGILNSLKVSELATKVKERCKLSPDQKSCIRGLLKEKDIFEFEDKNQEVFEEAKIVFPFCSSKKVSQDFPVDCEKQEDLFKRIRKEALLNPDSGSWSLISCLYKTSGFPINAKFFDEMEKLKGRSNIQMKKNAFSSLMDARYLKYLVGKENYTPELEDHIISEINSIPKYQRLGLLKNITSLHGGEFIKKLLEKENLHAEVYTDIAGAVAFANPRINEAEEFLKKLLEIQEPDKWLLVKVLDIVDNHEMSQDKKTKVYDSILEKDVPDSYVLSRLVDSIEKGDSSFEIDRKYYEKVLNHPQSNYSVATGVVESMGKYKIDVLDAEEIVEKAIAKGVFLVKALVKMRQEFPKKKVFIQEQIQKDELDDFQLKILLEDLELSESLSKKEKSEIVQTIQNKRKPEN
jgi:hypothetical protein